MNVKNIGILWAIPSCSLVAYILIAMVVKKFSLREDYSVLTLIALLGSYVFPFSTTIAFGYSAHFLMRFRLLQSEEISLIPTTIVCTVGGMASYIFLKKNHLI